MIQNRREIAAVSQKWGFGMAPPKSSTQENRVSACESLLKVLNSVKCQISDDGTLSSMSIVKGMFNRVVKEDQWDWFTVSGQLGYPSRRISRVIAGEIASLREATKLHEAENFKLLELTYFVYQRDVAYRSFLEVRKSLMNRMLDGYIFFRHEKFQICSK